MNCKHCGDALSKSIYRNNESLKSCPGCSKSNGSYHVFHSYFSDFGITSLRSSSIRPEGPQSHCERCRGGKPPSGGLLCKDID